LDAFAFAFAHTASTTVSYADLNLYFSSMNGPRMFTEKPRASPFSIPSALFSEPDLDRFAQLIEVADRSANGMHEPYGEAMGCPTT
jgi:hypothetical protein